MNKNACIRKLSLKWMTLIIALSGLIFNCKSAPQTVNNAIQKEIATTKKIVDEIPVADHNSLTPAARALIDNTLDSSAANIKACNDISDALKKKVDELTTKLSEHEFYYKLGRDVVYGLYAVIAGAIAYVVYKVVTIFKPKIG